jgi:bifunctional DNase/RNase
MLKPVVLLSVLLITSLSLAARELPDDLLPVDVLGVQIHPQTQTPVVLLLDPQTEGLVPIFIGPQEAQAIRFAMDSISTPRPMTHDLMVTLLRSFEGELERLIIDQLTQNTYLGLLEINRPNHDAIYLDVRPSDGLALAVRTGAAVWVASELLVYPDASGRLPMPSGPSL